MNGLIPGLYQPSPLAKEPLPPHHPDHDPQQEHEGDGGTTSRCLAGRRNKGNGSAETLTQVNEFPGQDQQEQGVSMQTNVEGCLALARVRFEPVACMLDRLAEDIEKEHGQPAVLEQTGPMEPMAQNVCSVRYSLGHPDEARLALTFVVTGESADRLLLQAQEQPGPEDIRVNPGPVDQHVYRVEKIDDIREAVQEKFRAHLRTRGAQGPGRVVH